MGPDKQLCATYDDNALGASDGSLVWTECGRIKKMTLCVASQDDGLNMPFIALPIHRGSSFTGRRHDFHRDLLSTPVHQVRDWFFQHAEAAVASARACFLVPNFW